MNLQGMYVGWVNEKMYVFWGIKNLKFRFRFIEKR